MKQFGWHVVGNFLFHARDAATAKARSPRVRPNRCTDGTTSVMVTVYRGCFFMILGSDGLETFFLRQRYWPRRRYRNTRRAKTFRIWSDRSRGRDIVKMLGDLRQCRDTGVKT